MEKRKFDLATLLNPQKTHGYDDAAIRNQPGVRRIPKLLVIAGATPEYRATHDSVEQIYNYFDDLADHAPPAKIFRDSLETKKTIFIGLGVTIALGALIYGCIKHKRDQIFKKEEQPQLWAKRTTPPAQQAPGTQTGLAH